jgi:hypothetical protein
MIDSKQQISNAALGAGALGIIVYGGLKSLPMALSLATICAAKTAGITTWLTNTAAIAILATSTLFFPPLCPLAATYVGCNFANELQTLPAMAPLGIAGIATSAYMFMGLTAKNPTATMIAMSSCAPVLAPICAISFAHSFIKDSHIKWGVTGVAALLPLATTSIIPQAIEMVKSVISPDVAAAALFALSYTPHILACAAAAAGAYKIYQQL